MTAITPAGQRQQQQAERRQAVSDQASHDPYVREIAETFDAQIVAIHPLDEPDG